MILIHFDLKFGPENGFNPGRGVVTGLWPRSCYRNLLKLREEESVCRKLVSLFHDLPMFDYYRGLNEDAVKRSKANRLEQSRNNTNTLSERYHHLID